MQQQMVRVPYRETPLSNSLRSALLGKIGLEFLRLSQQLSRLHTHLSYICLNPLDTYMPHLSSAYQVWMPVVCYKQGRIYQLTVTTFSVSSLVDNITKGILTHLVTGYISYLTWDQLHHTASVGHYPFKPLRAFAETLFPTTVPYLTT